MYSPAPAFNPPDPNHARRRHRAQNSALQNALQQPAAGGCRASQPEMTNPTKPADCKALRVSAARCEGTVSGSVVPTGFEPGDVTPSESTDLRHTRNQRAAECAAVGDDSSPIDPDLASVIEVWDTLPPAICEAILAMLRAAE